MNKSIKAYKTISEVVKIIGLNQKKVNFQHILYVIGKKNLNKLNQKFLNGGRRYYDEKNIELLKKFIFF